VATLREQIVAAIVTALSAGSPPATVYRTRRAAFQEGAAFEAIVVRPQRALNEEVSRPHAPLTRQRFTVEIEMFATGTATDRPDKVVDALYEWVVQKLVGNNLGQIAHGITEGDSVFDWGDAGEYANVKLTTEMIVSFSYIANDPTRKT